MQMNPIVLDPGPVSEYGAGFLSGETRAELSRIPSCFRPVVP